MVDYSSCLAYNSSWQWLYELVPEVVFQAVWQWHFENFVRNVTNEALWYILGMAFAKKRHVDRMEILSRKHQRQVG